MAALLRATARWFPRSPRHRSVRAVPSSTPTASPRLPRGTSPWPSPLELNGFVVDEVGYIPFEPEAAKLFFQRVSSRYEGASCIVTSNKQFGRWCEVFGDEVVAAAMIDRLAHPDEVIALKGDSYRLKDRDLGRISAASTTDDN